MYETVDVEGKKKSAFIETYVVGPKAHSSVSRLLVTVPDSISVS